MALPLAKAAPLKPQIKLAQALSEFEAVLTDDEKTKLRGYRRQPPPSSIDVIQFTAEIDRDASRNRKSPQCVGTRLTNVLHAVQQFSTIVDTIVGSSQSHIASAIWGTVKISLQLASAISSYFDQLSILFMRIGLTSPRYQDFGLLYPASTRLQSALCEYFVVIVCLCKQAVLFLNKPVWSQLSFSIFRPFESQFSGFHQDLENLAGAIGEEISLASNLAQQNGATDMSKFRELAKKFSDTSTRDLGEAKTWKRKKEQPLFLNACSVYDHERSWKQARRRGNTNWICHDESYKLWKQEKVSSTLWLTGILGSGKTVLAANVVEDLKITTPAVVAYFFCRLDEVESLQARTIVGSIARQIFHSIKPDIVDEIIKMRSGTFDIDQIVDYIQKLLPSHSHGYFIIIDGLDECEEKELRLLLQCLKQLLMSKTALRVYCSSRPDVSRWAHTILEPQRNVSMSQNNPDMVEYIEGALEQRLESGNLFVRDPSIILSIRDALVENAHGMFLWVALQIDSICSQTDSNILVTLKDLPEGLQSTFSRILRKLQQSKTADPGFCRKIFDLVATAQRPLTVEQLHEAVSVKPGEIAWDASKLVDDMLNSFFDCCGSLLFVDEEDLTVHFAHHSVKQFLLSEPTDSGLRKYHINMEEANLYMGDIIVTYLNFGIFHRQFTEGNSTMPPQVVINPSATLGSLPRSSFANRSAVRLLKGREESGEKTETVHSFLSYAQEYWLFHTKAFKPTRVAGYTLWQRLINDEVRAIKLPWAPKKWDEFGDEYMKWIIQNEHWALIDLSLVKINGNRSHDKAAILLLEFLEKEMTDTNIQNINLDVTFFVASYLNNKAVVLLSIRNGADINVSYGGYGSALQAASAFGHEEIVRLLLENGADVNVERGFFGTAFQAASENGHEEIARLLLENRADVIARGEGDGNVLEAASNGGYEETASSSETKYTISPFREPSFKAYSEVNDNSDTKTEWNNGKLINLAGSKKIKSSYVSPTIVPRTDPRITPLENGLVRLRWKCSCNHVFKIDVLEHRKGAAAAAISQLDQDIISDDTESKPPTLFWRLVKRTKSLLALLFRQPQPNDTLPTTSQNSETGNSAQYSVPLPNPPPDRYICVCFPSMTYKKYLHHVDANKAIDDRQLFAALRREYFDSKPLWKGVVTIRALARVEYFEFKVFHSNLVTIKEDWRDRFPQGHGPGEWSYLPTSRDMTPYLIDDVMTHYIHNPQCARLGSYFWTRIPKKVFGQLECPDDKPFKVGWGLYFVEEFSQFYLTVMLVPVLVIGIVIACWWCLQFGKGLAEGATVFSGFAAVVMYIFGVAQGWGKHNGVL